LASERLLKEAELIRRAYGEVEIGSGESWIEVKRFPLPGGWSHSETPLLVLIPVGYPVTPPDNFYCANELRLAGGGEPGNTSAGQPQIGRVWRMFSWHLGDNWRPDPDPLAGDNLLTFLLLARERLEELN
jgi:hypothetical protein